MTDTQGSRHLDVSQANVIVTRKLAAQWGRVTRKHAERCHACHELHCQILHDWCSALSQRKLVDFGNFLVTFQPGIYDLIFAHVHLYPTILDLYQIDSQPDSSWWTG